MSTVTTIVQNTNFTFMLDGKELEKYLFITIMNGKVLTYFITLHYMIDGEGSFVVHLINLFLNVTKF